MKWHKKWKNQGLFEKWTQILHIETAKNKK